MPARSARGNIDDRMVSTVSPAHLAILAIATLVVVAIVWAVVARFRKRRSRSGVGRRENPPPD